MRPAAAFAVFGGAVALGLWLASSRSQAAVAPPLLIPPPPTRAPTTRSNTPPVTVLPQEQAPALMGPTIQLSGVLQQYHVSNTSLLSEAQRQDVFRVRASQLQDLGYGTDPYGAINGFLAAHNLTYGPLGASTGEREAWVADKVDSVYRLKYGYPSAWA
jgi:hypothetical protein